MNRGLWSFIAFTWVILAVYFAILGEHAKLMECLAFSVVALLAGILYKEKE